jgi:two-component system sensor histidine kinase/response regulator
MAEENKPPVPARGLALLAVANPVQQVLVSELLQEAGMQVAVASHADEVLAQAAHRVPSIVLWDAALPGTDAGQAAARLRALPDLAGVPIVALSAGPVAQDRPTWLLAGLDDHLPQPVDPAQLRALLLQWLPSSPAAQDHGLSRQRWPAGLDVQAGLAFMAGNRQVYRQSLLAFARLYGAGLAGTVAQPAELRREAHALGGAAAVLGAREVLAQVRTLHGLIDRGAAADELTAAFGLLQQMLQTLGREIEHWAQNDG